MKNYIVYHRNSTKENPEIFPHGILHNHVSGIDFTFEQGDKPASAIRASVLIREYKVAKNGEVINESRPNIYMMNFTANSLSSTADSA